MYAKAFAAAAVLATGIASAKADTFVAGPLYQGDPAFTNTILVTCRLFNYGTKDVKIKTARIYNNVGTNLPLSGSCTPTVGPKKSCSITATKSGNVAHSCLIVTGTIATLSGAFEAQDNDTTVTAVIPLSHEP
jgi:hypothetical protein